MYVENRGELRRFLTWRRWLAAILIAVLSLMVHVQQAVYAQSDSHQVEITLEPLDEGYQLAMPSLLPPGPTTFNITNNTDVVQGFALVGEAIEPFLIGVIQPDETVSADFDLGEGTYLAYSPVVNYAALGMETVFFVTDERINPVAQDEESGAETDTETVGRSPTGDPPEMTRILTGTETMTGTIVLQAGERAITQGEFNDLFLRTLHSFTIQTGLPVNPLTLPLFEGLRQRYLAHLALQETLLVEAERRDIEVQDHQVDNMIMRAKQGFASEAAYQQALEAAGYADEAAFREAIRRDALVELVMAELLEEITVEDEEVRTFYEENEALFQTEPGEFLPLEEVDQRIRQALTMSKLEAMVADLHADAGVEIYAGNLEPLIDVLQQAASVSATSPMTGTEVMTGTNAVTDTSTMTETISGLSDVRTATATLMNGAGEVIGNAVFTQVDNDPVEIEVTIDQEDALRPGAHGIHIHTIGACTPDFEAAGAHLNPTRAQHGLENPNGPHAGDLPNLDISADGTGEYRHQSDLIILGDGATSLFDADGSALVIHAEPDNQVSDPSGSSGERIACGVIEPGTNSAADARE